MLQQLVCAIGITADTAAAIATRLLACLVLQSTLEEREQALTFPANNSDKVL